MSETPYHLANLPKDKELFAYAKETLSDDREIEVGFSAEGGRHVKIRRLDDDGKPCLLSFALSKDAARLLMRMLVSSFTCENSEDNPFKK